MTKIHDEVKLSTVEIKGEGEKLKVQSPYSPLFVERARDLGGEWLSKYKAWYFNPKDISRVKGICNEVYGTFGNPVKTVDMEVYVSNFSDRIQTLYLKGIKVAERRSRDSNVKLYNSIVKEGGFPSRGGSAKYPALSPDKNTTLEVRNIPKTLAEELVEENEEIYKIIRENEGINKKEHGWLVTFLNEDRKPVFYNYQDKGKMKEELPEILDETIDKDSITIIEPGFGFSIDNFV